MNLFKKLMVVFVAVMMVMSLTSRVYADDETAGETEETYKISGGKENHTYTVLQLFTGDLSNDGTTLSNLKWPDGTVFTKDQIDELKALVEDLDGASEVEIANAMWDAYESTAVEVGTLESADDEISGLPAGYYLIHDTTEEMQAGDAKTLYVLNVVNNVEFEPKTGTTFSEKKVQDINDSTETELSDLQDSADYDIGDDVPYTLTATLAENVHDYQTYHITFIDELESGKLRNNKDYTFYINEEELDLENLPDGLEVTVDTDSDNGFEITFEWSAGDHKQLNSANGFDLDEAEITVKFTAELLEEANIGAQGNINTLTLEYSNNPNVKDGSETDTTTPDTVIVFTYELVINKVQNNPDYDPEVEGSEQYISLDGAAFSLYKLYDNPDVLPEDAEQCTEEGYEDYYLVSPLEAEDGHTFSFAGIDDGQYLLVETETPNGYNTIAPIEITVEATHEGEIQAFVENGRIYGDDGYLTLLDANGVSGDETIELTFTVDQNNDEALSADVVNQKGVVLPSTGGIGTTIFHIAGAALVLGAGILLISKKRMNNN